MDEQNYLSEKILNILLTLRDQSVEEIANYDIKDEWDTVGTAHCKAQHRGIRIPRDSSDPWIKKCCHYINCLDGDCDVALRSVVIYWLAFLKNFGKADGWKIERQDNAFEKYQLRKDGEEMLLRGDTMNSYVTPVVGTRYPTDGLLRCFLINKHDEYMIAEGILKSKSNKEFADKYQEFKRNNIGDKYVWSAYILDKYEKFIERFEDTLVKNEIPKEAVYEYVHVNDTLGNFIPVPKSFNAPRYNSTKDFWDLTLWGIYKFFNEKGDLSDIISETKSKEEGEEDNCNEGAIGCCQEWLKNSFGEPGKDNGSWDNFVKQNFMQDFVNQEGSHYGKPKELWMGHFGGSVILGGDERCAQYTEFFTNASALIHARSIRIAMTVKNVLDGKNHEDLTALANKMVCG